MAADPIDWSLAVRTARKVARAPKIDSTYHARSLDASFASVAVEAHEAVADLTGLNPPHLPEVRVVDRAAWAEANVAVARRMLSPVLERLGSRMSGPVQVAGRTFAGLELGTVLGVLSKHVLGQYDITAGAGAEPDLVMFVRPNLLETEKRYGFRPEEFRRWIAFHELTHHAQFRAIPWLAGHFQGCIDEMATLLDPDPRRLILAVTRVLEGIVTRKSPIAEGGVPGLFATSAQRDLLARIQTLMSAIEGHATWVMNELGEHRTNTSQHMAATLSQRRQSPTLLSRVMGLDAKAKQYDRGEAFFREIACAGGKGLTREVWSSAAMLPTASELDSPAQWLSRVHSAA
ncbi:MAG: zinc-dependent metalloprotease [Acidimicrobiia bacterium]